MHAPNPRIITAQGPPVQSLRQLLRIPLLSENTGVEPAPPPDPSLAPSVEPSATSRTGACLPRPVPPAESLPSASPAAKPTSIATASHRPASRSRTTKASPAAEAESHNHHQSYNVEVRDSRVRAFLDALPSDVERREQLGRAVELGVLALQAARPMDAAVEIQQRFQQLTEKLQHDTTGAFDSEISQLRTDLGGVLATVERQISVLDEKAHHIVDQEKRLDELIHATELDPQLMGANFEARLVNNLDRFAAPRVGDSVTYTGNSNEVDAKVGDIVYRLAINGNPDDTVGVAIEARDRPCTRSGLKAFFLDELDEGMANRNCSYGVVVTTIEKNSDKERPTFPFIQALPGKRFVVLVDELVHYPIALEATLQAIHKEVVAARASSTPGVDVKRINDAVVRALEVGEMFRALKSNMTSQLAELKKMRDNVDRMESQFENSLKEAQQEIQRSTAGNE